MLLAQCPAVDGQTVLVGSSMGGHVATAAAAEVGAVGLFVLAPAYYIEEWQVPTPEPPGIPTVIVHGWRDDIVPVDVSLRFARPRNAALHLLDSGHTLNDQLETLAEVFGNLLKRL